MPKTLGIDLPGCFVAGGAVLSAATRTEISDYDIYPKSNAALLDAIATLIDEDCFIVNISDRAITLKHNGEITKGGQRCIYQLMTFAAFPTAADIFQNFDFTVCMAAFDHDTKQYTYHDDFWQDVASKTIRFNPNTRYPLNSLLRTIKYQRKGYVLGKMEMVRLALTILTDGGPTSWEELGDQIGGSYGRTISLNVDKTQEFTLSNAIDALEGLPPEAAEQLDNSDAWSNVGLEHILIYFDERPLRYVQLPDGRQYVISAENTLSHAMFSASDLTPKILADLYRNKQKVCVNLGPNGETIPTRLYGYKVLRVDSVDPTKLLPAIYTYNPRRVEYRVGMETVENASPHLFVFPSINNTTSHSGKDKKVFLVSFDVNDIRSANGSEQQVSRLRVEHEVGVLASDVASQ